MIREVLSSALFLLPLTLAFLIIVVTRVRALSQRTAHDVIPYLRGVNLEEIKTLLDPATERYLRLNSTAQEFKRTQWKRCHLALQYVNDMAHNAKVFQEWGKYERNRSRTTRDSEIRRASLDLTVACAQCRICAVAGCPIRREEMSIKLAASHALMSRDVQGQIEMQAATHINN